MPSKSNAFPRSAIASAILLHLDGTFAPTKVSLIEMRTYNVPFQFILLANWIAAFADKCCHR